jgi:hypothetical protein
MASAAARKAAITRATSQVNAGNGFVRRAASIGSYQAVKTATKTSKKSRG